MSGVHTVYGARDVVEESALSNGCAEGLKGIRLDVREDEKEDESKKKPKRRGRKSVKVSWHGGAMRVRRTCRRWGIILAIAACLLFFLEVRILSPSRLNSPKDNAGDNHGLGKAKTVHSNLNNLDMPTRMVAGVHQPCLQLLQDHEIQSLQLPPPSASPVKELHYWSDESSTFSGEPTMAQRSASFQMEESMEVHCGWCGGGSGFDIDAVDKAFMDTCSVVIVTCAFGGGDDLHQPIGYTNASVAKVCYVAFWDEVTQETQVNAGNDPGPDRSIGLWRIVLVHNLPFADQRRNGKIPKVSMVLTFCPLFTSVSLRLGVLVLLLESLEIVAVEPEQSTLPKKTVYSSAYVEPPTVSKCTVQHLGGLKVSVRRDPIGVLEALLWRPGVVFAISEHGARSCVYKEGEMVVKKHKATPEEVAIQLDQYRSEGLPESARFDGHKALAEASVIVREHTGLTNLFMCVWFNEVMRFTARDQLSFPFVLTRFRLLHPHMFPVCTRKALVNSLGHVRKAQPLLLDR